MTQNVRSPLFSKICTRICTLGRASGDWCEAARVLGDRPEVQLGERQDEAEDRRDGGQERRAEEEAGRRTEVQGAGSITSLRRVAQQV